MIGLAARVGSRRRPDVLGDDGAMPTWIPGPNDPTVVPDEYIDLLPPPETPGTMMSWYNPVDWAKGAWGGTKYVSGKVWDGTKWVANKAIDPCTYMLGVTLPAHYVPGLKDIVRKNGCTPTGQRLGALAFSLYATSQGGPLAGLAAQVGAGIFYRCLCAKWEKELGLPPDKQQASQASAGASTPIVLGGIALLAAGIYAVAKRRSSASRAGLPVVKPGPAAKQR